MSKFSPKSGLGKIFCQNRLTVGMLMETTLNLYRSVMKVVYWIGKSGSGNPNIGSMATPYLQVTWSNQILDQNLAHFWTKIWLKRP